MENCLEIKKLRVNYKTLDENKNVLDIENLCIKKGTTFGIVGESGSGKTVLAQTILGLLPCPPGVIESGEILLDGEDLFKKNKKEMEKIRGARISMIFQDPLSCLNPVYTVGEQMVSILQAHKKISKKEAMATALDMIKKVKLPDAESTINKYPHELSGGQRQRIIIAMALLCDAELLIADEPTRNLDVTIQAGILKLIADLQKEFGVTVLFIANNLGLVSAVCDEVAVLKDGKIIEQMDAKKLVEEAKNPYTKTLINAITPELDQARKEHTYDPNDKIIVAEHVKKYFPVKSKKLLSKEKKTVKAVDDLTFSIAKKETVGIVGESGCGKSTLVNTIMLLHLPTDGTISILGKDITKVDAKELKSIRKQVQIVFQDPFWSLDPRWLVKDIIGEPIKVHKNLNEDEYIKEVSEIAELVGLTKEDIFKYPHEFSGGQRQRIAIARALSVKPKLIILDEPTSAIDVMSQAQILSLLESLKEKMELSYIIISHDMSVVNYMADNIMVMYLGKIVEYGKANVVFNDPKHPYTKALFNAIPSIKTKSIDQLSIIKGEVPSAINPPKGCRFNPRCEHCMERCKCEEPKPKMVDGREVACFLFDKEN
jgi:peptide/nickel transport system ATP-binding protein